MPDVAYCYILKIVDVVIGNPVIDSKADADFVCDIRNSGKPIIHNTANENSVCDIPNTAFCYLLKNVASLG